MSTSNRVLSLALMLGVGVLGVPGVAGAESPEVVVATPDALQWTDIKSVPGAQMALIQGDPKQPGPLTFQIRFPADAHVAAHTHPDVEHVTVLSGTLYLVTGDELSRDRAESLPAGSVIVMPAGTKMEGWTDTETLIQVSSNGPWDIVYLNPEDDPRKQQ